MVSPEQTCCTSSLSSKQQELQRLSAGVRKRGPACTGFQTSSTNCRRTNPSPLTLFRLGFSGQSVTEGGGGGVPRTPLCISGTNNARVMKFTHNDHLRTKKPHT